MSRGGSTTLYVTGFGHGTRARELAHEFERYGRLVRCDIPAPRSQQSRLFAFVEYERRADSDEAYYDMHNRRIGRDDILKIEWARTPPSANWRFEREEGREGGRDAGRGSRDGGRDRRRSPRRRSGSPGPRRGGRDSPASRKDDRRDRDYERRDRDRSRSPDGDKEMKDVRRDDDEPANGVNGDDAKVVDSPMLAHDELDTAE